MRTINLKGLCRMTRLLGGVGSTALAASAAAQTPPSEPARPAATVATPGTSAVPNTAVEAASTDDIVVTGSRIRGVAPVGSNLISVGRDDINKSAATTTNDILQQIPQLAAIGGNEAGGTAQFGAANAVRQNSINLRGLGNRATLTLFDGHRAVPMGTQGQLVDASTFPSLAIERIEVIADGASAVYGSDAVAGVVNFIPRKSYDGVGVQVRGSRGTEYWDGQVGVIAGAAWDTGNVMIAGEYGGHSRLDAIDRDFITSDQRPFGGADFRPQTCTPGNIVVGSTFYPLPGGSGQLTASQLRAGAPNRCDLVPNDTILPSVRRYSGVAFLRQELGEHVELYAEGYATRRDSTLFNRTQAQTLSVPLTNAFFVSPVAGARTVNVQYNLAADVGPQPVEGRSDVYQVTGGVRVKISDNWRGDVSYTYGRSNDRIVTGPRVNAGALAAALADSNPATALNVFGSGGISNPTTVAGLFTNIFLPYGRISQWTLGGQADGPLFPLPGGEVRVAFGGEHRNEKLSSGVISGPATAPGDAGFSASRNVDSAFGELFVPLFGPNNGTTLLHSLNLDVAVRYENYSDIGSTTNPKAGATWTPVEGLDLRGSIGRSFRAPALPENSLRTGGFGLYSRNFPDPQSPTGFNTGISFVAGNPNLAPEKAKTWSYGLDLAPRALPGLRLGLTYFGINYRNQITTVDGDTSVLQNPLYAPFVIRNPTAAQLASFLTIDGIATPISGVLPATIGFIVDGRRQNLGTVEMRGIDYNLSYRFGIFEGNTVLGINGSHLTALRNAVVPGGVKVDVLGRINYPLRDRFRTEATWSRGRISASAFVNYNGAYNNNLVTPIYRIRSWTTVDASIGYDFEEMQVRLSGSNIFDRDPPRSNSTSGYDPQAASPVGRLVSLTVMRKF